MLARRKFAQSEKNRARPVLGTYRHYFKGPAQHVGPRTCPWPRNTHTGIKSRILCSAHPIKLLISREANMFAACLRGYP